MGGAGLAAVSAAQTHTITSYFTPPARIHVKYRQELYRAAQELPRTAWNIKTPRCERPHTLRVGVIHTWEALILVCR